jgi:hypothetical protein
VKYPRALGAVLLLAGLTLTASAQTPPASTITPAQWHADQMRALRQSSAIMKRVHRKKSLLAQYQVMRHAYYVHGGRAPPAHSNQTSPAASHGGNAAHAKPSSSAPSSADTAHPKPDDLSYPERAFRVIFGQYLSWYQTFIGDYKDAELSFSIDQEHHRGDAPSPLKQPGWHAVPALEYIAQRAKNRRVVFVNEAHNIALTRTLTVRLLKPLRQEGFNVFAVETLYHGQIKALNQRGYPVADSGFYTRGPIYAEMVRTALKLGYRVVAYEADRYHTGDAREAQQASNLWKILKNNPNAKLLVNAGYAHIKKTGAFLGDEQSMAEHFIKDSGLDPLSVEQTIMIPHQDRALDYPYYDSIIQALDPQRPIVFVNKDGNPWSVRPGYDISVIFPEEHFVDGRPSWASLWGARVPYTVNGSLCRRHWPCMIAARYADEGPDSVPADRMVLDPVPLMIIDNIKVTSGDYSMPTGQLYLRPGHRYRLTVTDQSGATLDSSMITVAKRPASHP